MNLEVRSSLEDGMGSIGVLRCEEKGEINKIWERVKVTGL